MDGPTQKTNRTSWLALLRAGGESDLGAAMVRLAKLAAATHQVEADLADDAEHASRDRLDDVRELQGRSSGLVARAGTPGRGDDHAGPFRREVER